MKNQYFKQIENFEYPKSDWIELDKIISKIDLDDFCLNLESIFKIFEKYPEEDGDGVFWTLLHKIERCKNYEKELINSLQRKSSELTIIMLMRIQNSGKTFINKTAIKSLARELLERNKLNENMKEDLLFILAT